jgi:hypothetical protein
MIPDTSGYGFGFLSSGEGLVLLPDIPEERTHAFL